MDKVEKENFFIKVYKKVFEKNKQIKLILLWYLIIWLAGSILLILPFSLNQNINFIDSLFISASAFSDTGLNTVVVSESFTFFGQFVILILIILGGIGFFTTKVFFINFLFKNKISNEQREQASQEIFSKNINHSLEVIKTAIYSMLIAIILFGIIFGISFFLLGDEEWWKSIWTGLFHATSSINNAGIDIFKNDVSMQEYYYNIFIQFLTMFLFIFGGIGFPIIHDLKMYLKNKKNGTSFKFSLFTKISALTYFIVAFGGLSITFFSEMIYYFINPETSFYGIQDTSMNLGNAGWRTWALTFNTFSSRNAGFSTIDMSLLGTFTKVNLIGMMFIGSGPGSTAGGIRTTTLAVLVIGLYSKIFKTRQIGIFNKAIREEVFDLSLKITYISLILVFLCSGSVFLSEYFNSNNSNNSFVDYLFLSASSFGTTGLSTMPLSEFNPWSKLMIIIVMFIGQYGVANIIQLFKKEDDSKTKVVASPKRRILIYETINLS